MTEFQCGTLEQWNRSRTTPPRCHTASEKRNQMRMGSLDSEAAALSAAYKQIRSKRKTMRLKFAIGFAALTVGAALASVPAVAQQQGVSGYSSQGAVVAIHPYRHHRLYNYAPQRAHRHTAKTPDRLPSNNNGDM